MSGGSDGTLRTKNFDKKRHDCRQCGAHWVTYVINRDTSDRNWNKRAPEKAKAYGICSICAEKRWRKERQRVAAEKVSRRLELEEQKWRMLQ